MLLENLVGALIFFSPIIAALAVILFLSIFFPGKSKEWARKIELRKRKRELQSYLYQEQLDRDALEEIARDYGVR